MTRRLTLIVGVLLLLAVAARAQIIKTIAIQQHALPTPFIEWLFDEGSGNLVFNQEGTKATLRNTLGVGNFWGTASARSGAAVVTNEYANDQNGNPIASRVQGTGDLGFGFVNGTVLSLPAGTYTLSAYVKSNTGSTQTFVMWMHQPADGYLFSGSLSATTSWTRVTLTQTTAIGIDDIFLRPDADADYLIANVQLEAAGAATAFADEQYDAVVGYTQSTNSGAPAWDSTGVSFTDAAQHLIAVSKTPKVFSTITVYVATLTTSFGALFRNILDTPTAAGGPGLLSLYAENKYDDSPHPHTAEFTFRTRTEATAITPLDSEWHIYTGQYDGTNVSLWFDNALAAQTLDAGLASVSVPMLYLAYTHASPTFGYAGKIGLVRIFDTAHTAAQRAAQLTDIRAKMALRSVTISPITDWTVFEGDSITEGTGQGVQGGVESYARRALALLTPIRQGRNVALTGSTLSDLTSRAVADDAMQMVGAAHNTFVVLIGANDLASVAPATFVANLKTYCQARQAAGWKVVLLTVLPRTLGGFNTNRNTANGLIRADPSFYDALADVGDTGTTMGADAAAADTSLYYDGLHPTDLGYDTMSQIVADAINSVL